MARRDYFEGDCFVWTRCCGADIGDPFILGVSNHDTISPSSLPSTSKEKEETIMKVFIWIKYPARIGERFWGREELSLNEM